MKYLLIVMSMPLYGAQLSQEERDQVKKIYESTRRNAITEDTAKVERPDEDKCVSANNLSFDRISFSRKYTVSKPKKSEHKN